LLVGWKTLAAVPGVAALIAVTPATAQAPAGPYAPYDGHNPFNCELQQAGTGTEFPDPEADPFCVEFDKTQQNVTDFGLADFLSKEPARAAAASAKCFYFQHDHWTGSVVQGGQPETWHWDGSYFFDKAQGRGGVYVENFRIGGAPADWRPYAPPEFQPYLAPGGGGGVLLGGEVEPDPRCAERVDSPIERRFVYHQKLRPGKIFRKRITPVRLRTLRSLVIRRLGPAHRHVDHTDRWDVQGSGDLRAAWRGSALDRRVAALLTTSPGHSRGRINPGDRARGARRALRAHFASRVAGYRVFEAPRRRRGRLLLGVDGGKVAWIAVLDPRLIPDRATRPTLRNLLSRDG
jgi:hypothetical protein